MLKSENTYIHVFLKRSFSITVLLAFWLIGFPLANCRSDSPFMAYKFSELYVYNEASNANIFAKFTVQVRNRINSKNVISIIHFLAFALFLYKSHLLQFFIAVIDGINIDRHSLRKWTRVEFVVV